MQYAIDYWAADFWTLHAAALAFWFGIAINYHARSSRKIAPRMKLSGLVTALSFGSTVFAHGGPPPTTQDEIVLACTAYMTQGFTWPFCNEKGKRGGNRPRNNNACYCGQDEFLKSTLSCLDALDPSVKARHSHFKALVSFCKGANLTVSHLDDLDVEVPDLPLLTAPSSYAARKVKEAFKVPVAQYKNAFRAYRVNMGRDDRGIVLSIGMMCFWFGLVVLRTFFHWTRNIFPSLPHKLDSKPVRWIRKTVTMPPMLTFNHSTPATLGKSRLGSFFTFNLPTRQSTFVLLAFTAVHFGLLFGGLDIVPDNYSIKLDGWGSQYSKALGIRSGWFIVFLMPPMFLFAGRNNFMIQMTGWPLDEFSVYHKWLGRFCFIDLVVHAAAYTWLYIHQNRFTSSWREAYWNHGVASTVFGCIMVFTAAHCFRKLSYEFFLVTHILLAVGFLVGGYYHVYLLGDEIRPYYAVIAIWGFDRAARLARVLLASPFARAKVTYHNGHTIELTITYSKLWKVPAGSYIFVHIVQPMFFWESHPFTVMRSVKNEEEGCIKLFARGMSGMTKRLVDKCQANNGSIETTVWLDGPYHQYINMDRFKEALFIGGGIGITAPFSFAQGRIAKGQKDITIHWGIRDTAPLEWFAAEIDYMLQHGVKLYIHVGDESAVSSSNASFDSMDKEKLIVSTTSSMNLKQGRMNIAKIVSEAAQNASGPLAVLCCGPGPVNDSTRQAVVANITTSPHYMEYFEESFSW